MSLTDIDHRRLRLAWFGGGGVGLVVFGWLLTAGRWAFLEHRQLGDLYDAQGRAFLDGRLDLPPQVVGYEGFVDGGRTYMYFGPLPALLRLPVLAVTDRFDGRLTTLSMLLGVIVLVVASYRLSGALRNMVRGRAPVGRRETWATAVLALAVVLGPPITLASGSQIYHEAIVWGLALTVAGFDAVARWQRQPDGRRLAGASAVVLLGLLSRPSMGLGPLVALGLAGGARVGRSWHRAGPPPGPALSVGAAVALDIGQLDAAPEPGRPRWPGSRRWRLLGEAALVLLALLVPLALSMGLHEAKLGTPVGLPFERQVAWQHSSENREWFEANPTPSLDHLRRTLPTYFRPVGLELRRSFPWVDFPRDAPARLNEGLPVDVVDWSSSLPTTTPAWGTLAVAGTAWAIRTRPTGWGLLRGHRRDASSRLWPLMAGGLAPVAVVLTYPFVANRYLNDLYLVVLLGGLVGFHALGATMPGWSRRTARAVTGGVGLLVVAGCGVNLVLALELQRERWFLIPDEWRDEWIQWRVDLPGSPEPMRIDAGQPLPPAVDGALLVVGDCDALYTGIGPPRGVWMPVDPAICHDVNDAGRPVDRPASRR